MRIWHTHGSPNIGQKTRPYNNVNFLVPADFWIKLKECEKKDKYRIFDRELKKLWNMKMTIIPIVIGAFGIVTKGLLKGLEDLEFCGRVETIQTTALLRTARILRRVLEIMETCCHPISCERPSAGADVKNPGEEEDEKEKEERENYSKPNFKAGSSSKDKQLSCPLVIYSWLFLKWTREELQLMDQRIRKLMTTSKKLHWQAVCVKKKRREWSPQYLRWRLWKLETKT